MNGPIRWKVVAYVVAFFVLLVMMREFAPTVTYEQKLAMRCADIRGELDNKAIASLTPKNLRDLQTCRDSGH